MKDIEDRDYRDMHREISPTCTGRGCHSGRFIGYDDRGSGSKDHRPCKGAYGMKVTLAKSAGFCFGVKRAVDMVYEQIEDAKEKTYLYLWSYHPQ